MKKVIFLIVLFSSCSASKQSNQYEVEDELFTQAFCALLDEKESFRTPELKGDSIRILNYYFIDTTSLYYNFTNSSFEIQFVDTDNFPQHKGRKDDWIKYTIFSSLRSYKGFHLANSKCLQQKKIKFINKEDILDKFEAYNTLAYSPLIRFKKDHYKIYEHRFSKYQNIYYTYIFKRVNNNFEFIDRTYHSDAFQQVKEDYMKTIDFNLTYEEFIANRK